MSSQQVLGEPQTNTGRHTDILRIASLISVAVGLFISGYLSYLKLATAPAACIAGGPFDCNLVLNSLYSTFLGIPIAYLGFGLYLIIGSLLLLEDRISILQTDGRLILFGLALFGWIYSMWLVYVQFFVLQALCPWCLSHEANFTILFFMTSLRLWREIRQPAEA